MDHRLIHHLVSTCVHRALLSGAAARRFVLRFIKLVLLHTCRDATPFVLHSCPPGGTGHEQWHADARAWVACVAADVGLGGQPERTPGAILGRRGAIN
jgi:hypothetical protein